MSHLLLCLAVNLLIRLNKDDLHEKVDIFICGFIANLSSRTLEIGFWKTFSLPKTKSFSPRELTYLQLVFRSQSNYILGGLSQRSIFILSSAIQNTPSIFSHSLLESKLWVGPILADWKTKICVILVLKQVEEKVKNNISCSFYHRFLKKILFQIYLERGFFQTLVR